MVLRIAKQNTTRPENDFIIKFQPFIIMCDTLDHQNMIFNFGNVSGSGTGPLDYGSGTGHRATPMRTVSGSGSL